MKSKGILFGDFHSYRDFGLVLNDANIPPALPKTTYVEIPGSDEPLDTTEALGEVQYDCRDCKFIFVVDSSVKTSFEDKKTEVSNALNGRKFKITLDADDAFYYYGRVTVDNYAQRGNLRQIVMSANVAPYKMKRMETVVSQTITDEGVVSCYNERKSVVPIITTDADFVLKFNNISVAVSAGETIVPDIKFVQGENVVTCIGTGNVTFTYREGSL